MDAIVWGLLHLEHILQTHLIAEVQEAVLPHSKWSRLWSLDLLFKWTIHLSFGGINEDEPILAMAETRKRQQNATSKLT
jgi:hypothetical protein